MPPILQLDVQQIISQAISFLILLWVLRRFAWRPLLSMLDQRRERIEQDLAQAAAQKEELTLLEQEYRKRLATIDQEARVKIQEAIQESKRIAMEIQGEARLSAQAILTKANETIELELAKAKVTLRDQVAQMTMSAVERILQKKLDAETDRFLVEAFLEDLERPDPKSA